MEAAGASAVTVVSGTGAAVVTGDGTVSDCTSVTGRTGAAVVTAVVVTVGAVSDTVVFAATFWAAFGTAAVVSAVVPATVSETVSVGVLPLSEISIYAVVFAAASDWGRGSVTRVSSAITLSLPAEHPVSRHRQAHDRANTFL